MAQAIGITTPTSYDGARGPEAGGYLLHGELIGPGFNRGVIDLIEFTIPRNDAPPYSSLNHLGMARATFHTTDLAGDYQQLLARGVPFLSAPVTRANGERFAIFTDPDGTFYELREEAGERDPDARTQIHRIGAVSINVSDFERSAAWYAMLGFEQTAVLPPTDSIEVARAMGFDEQFELRGAVFTHRLDGSQLELVQWIHPYSDTPLYPIPINFLGLV